MSEEPVDPDRLAAAREAAEALPNATKYAHMQHLIAALIGQAGGRVTLPLDWEERAISDGKVIFEREEDGAAVFTTVEDPPTERAQAILDGGADWLRPESGAAVKVTGADGDMIAFVVELAPGRWSEPDRYHADCFLREHVLAAGVPLLG